MKKILSVFILLSLFSLGMQAKSLSTIKVDGDTTIIVGPLPGSDYPIPRGPVPISASYNSVMTSVILSFASNLGEIEVEVLNTITGYYDSGFIATWPLSAIIPISGGPGHYIITFTLPSGHQYRGTFDV